MFDFLNRGHSDTSFTPDDGAFRSKLIEVALDTIDEDCLESFSEQTCEVIVNLSPYTGAQKIIHFMVISDLGELSFEAPFTSLNAEEVSDLNKQVSQLHERQPSSIPSTDTKVVVRKKPMNGMLNSHEASKKLGCSVADLKKKVPCTDYSCNEVNGVKTITEYWWSPSLIERLCQMKTRGATGDDVSSIAKECCNGDRDWASDMLRSIGVSLPKQNPTNKAADGQQTQKAKVESKDGTSQNHSGGRPRKDR